MATTSRAEMTIQEAMMSATTPGPIPRKKVPLRSNKEIVRFTEGPTVTTRSMQKKKDLILLKLIESLPSISSVLVQAIASCQSDNGLSFAKLKEVLSTKGYNITRHCPSLKRKLNSLVSQGALVRMTHRNGSTYFVVRKYQEKDAEVLGNSDKMGGRTKLATGAERRKAMHTSAKMKRAAKQTQEARRTSQSPRKKLQPGVKQSRQSSWKSRSEKRSQSLTTKRSSHSGSKTTLIIKRPPSSSRRAASTSEKNLRKNAASLSKEGKSPVRKIPPKRSRVSQTHMTVSAKRRGRPRNQESPSTKKTRYHQSNNLSSVKEQRKAAISTQRLRSSMASSNSKKPRRR